MPYGVVCSVCCFLLPPRTALVAPDPPIRHAVQPGERNAAIAAQYGGSSCPRSWLPIFLGLILTPDCCRHRCFAAAGRRHAGPGRCTAGRHALPALAGTSAMAPKPLSMAINELDINGSPDPSARFVCTRSRPVDGRSRGCRDRSAPSYSMPRLTRWSRAETAGGGSGPDLCRAGEVRPIAMDQQAVPQRQATDGSAGTYIAAAG